MRLSLTDRNTLTLYLTGLCGYFNYCVRLTVNNRGEIIFEPKLGTQNLVNRENASKFQVTESCWCMKNCTFSGLENGNKTFGHLLRVPDTDDVKQKNKNHEKIPNRCFPEQKTKKSFVLPHLCQVQEVLT